MVVVAVVVGCVQLGNHNKTMATRTGVKRSDGRMRKVEKRL